MHRACIEPEANSGGSLSQRDNVASNTTIAVVIGLVVAIKSKEVSKLRMHYRYSIYILLPGLPFLMYQH